MVDIYLEYQGDLHCRAEHGPSKAALVTDAPLDNQGRGESFSPTDLIATGLGTCMATVMGILAKKRGFDLNGLSIHVEKTMTKTPPRRIARLAVNIAVPKSATEKVAAARTDFERAAHECPVRLSLLEAIEVPVVFDWQG